jgi:tryptophan 7-halogenase
MDSPGRINRVVVLGGGSAGFLAAMTLKRDHADLQVVVIRSKQIGVIGVGEGTTVSVPNFLHGYLNIDPLEFLRATRPTYKLGIRFLWGPRPYFNYTFARQFNLKYDALPRATGYYCYGPDDRDAEYACVNSALMTHDKAFVRTAQGAPGVRNDIAYHMENAEFVEFLEGYATKLGVQALDETVENVEQDERGVTALRCASGQRITGDLWIDCSGFLSLLLGKALKEPFVSFKSSLYCDRAVVGGWDRADEPIKPYTTAETMNSGWCWQIEHETRINRGYVYSADFISDEEAEREFRAKNPKITKTRVVPYLSGRYQRAWVKNVVGIGNAFGFVEPLESTALAAICADARALSIALFDSQRMPGPAMANAYNKVAGGAWDDIRKFLAIHYKFNRRLDTPFWRACLNDTDLAGADEYVDFYQENGPSPGWDVLIRGKDVFGIEGYLALMVGQKVPYKNMYTPSPQERYTWSMIQKATREQALAGMEMKESLDIIRSPNWVYRKNFYHANV